MPSAIEAMREAFGQLAAGRAEVPERMAVRVPRADGVLLVMPARADLSLGLGAKLVAVFPGNAERGLPLVQAIVALSSSGTGTPRAILEGGTLTALRTGAASGLATGLLARPEARRLAVIGAGVEARTQVEAVCCVREIAEVAVFSRTPARAHRFAADVAGRSGGPAEARVARSAAEAVAEADVVCVATTSREPVLRVGEVPAGCHVNAVGSYTPEMVELDPLLVARARLVVDRREAALAEAGEVIAAVRDGTMSRGDMVELGDIVAGTAVGRRSPGEITVFKSVGLAIQDLCAGARAVEEAERRGLGTVVEL